MTQESTESKIIWSIGRFFKNLFSGSPSRSDRRSNIDYEYIRARWVSVNDKMKQAGESNFQSAIIEADKLLGYALRERGAHGETLGERLKNSERLFNGRESYQAAWDAHKERNRIAHEDDHELLHPQARHAISNFEKALKGLRVL